MLNFLKLDFILRCWSFSELQILSVYSQESKNLWMVEKLSLLQTRWIKTRFKHSKIIGVLRRIFRLDLLAVLLLENLTTGTYLPDSAKGNKWNYFSLRTVSTWKRSYPKNKPTQSIYLRNVHQTSCLALKYSLFN